MTEFQLQQLGLPFEIKQLIIKENHLLLIRNWTSDVLIEYSQIKSIVVQKFITPSGYHSWSVKVLFLFINLSDGKRYIVRLCDSNFTKKMNKAKVFIDELSKKTTIQYRKDDTKYYKWMISIPIIIAFPMIIASLYSTPWLFFVYLLLFLISSIACVRYLFGFYGQTIMDTNS